MKQNRCCLCEGKVVNGICIECGMHNGKREEEYLLNRSSCDSEPLTHVHQESSSSTWDNTEGNKTKQEESREQIRRRMQEKKEERQQKQQERIRVKRQADANRKIQKAYGAGEKKKKSKVWIVVAIFIVLGVLADQIDNIFYNIYYKVMDLDIGGSQEEEEYTYDPYQYLERELAPEGEHFEQVFTAGCYVVGVDLPEGQYKAVVQERQGGIQVTDWENSLYLWESLGDGEYEDDLTEVQDLRLFAGAQMQITGGVVLLLTSENAQTDQMQESLANPLTESVTLEEGMYTAGEDFPQGTYDIQIASGRGGAELKYMEEDGEEYYVDSFYLNTDTSQKYDPSGVKYVVIPEGYYLTVSGGPITLVPSDRIISEDYLSYYEH